MVDPADPDPSEAFNYGQLSDDEKKNWQDFARVEFSALRAEIDRRSNSQQSILVLYITGIGIVTGAVLQGRLSLLTLLIVPFIAWATSAMFVDHHRQISKLGMYLSLLCQRSGYDRGAGSKNWERWQPEPGTHDRRYWRLNWRAAPYLLFGGTSALCLLASGYQVAFPTDSWTIPPFFSWTVWSIGFILTGATLFTLIGINLDANPVADAGND